MLTAAGSQAATVEDGRAAGGGLAHRRLRRRVMDLRMPVMERAGGDRHDPRRGSRDRTARTPVIVLSANTGRRTAGPAPRPALTVIIGKPIEAEALVEALPSRSGLRKR